MSLNQTKIINGPSPSKNSKVIEKVENNEKSSKTYANTVLLNQKTNQINDMNQGMPSAFQSLHNATRTSIHDNKVQPQIQIVNKDSKSSSSTTDKEWIPVIKHKRVNSSKVGTGKQRNTSSGIQGALKKSGYILEELLEVMLQKRISLII
ncbi:hypothetical protein WA026_011751 [Henosepilachna vigintioctopunctata]|uniref:Uncharacterized protein n=1 Tax=Henosepilachna vigintioctopunctata TaxID=420089 RepID=A0AAW1U9W9_9CUCU